MKSLRQSQQITDQKLRICQNWKKYQKHWSTMLIRIKGTVERHNGLIRRLIPKGDYIKHYSLQNIVNIETWYNSLPRKILAYHIPDEIFERELDSIYQTA